MKEFTRIVGVEGVDNLGIVKAGAIYRSAQPDWELHNLEKLKIKTVLNLRKSSEKDDVETFQMRSIEVPLNVFDNIDATEFDRVIDTMNNSDLQPLLVHCRQGQDRTGVICACYRLRIDGWSLEEAEEEMQSYGFNDLWFMLSRSLMRYAEARL
jgi:protein tyrosine/serine phosphatase